MILRTLFSECLVSFENAVDKHLADMVEDAEEGEE